MSLFYSRATRGFYDDQIHRSIPGDALPISDEEHQRLMQMQGTGKVIDPDDAGRPVAVDPPPMSDARKVELRTAEAMVLLEASDVRVLRSFEEGVPVPPAWVAYRAALRAVIASSSVETTIPPAPSV